MSSNEPARVYLKGVRVGTLEPAGGTDYTFTYMPETVAAAREGGIVLSHSLPAREEPYTAIPTRTFFEGLLPESARRDEIARDPRIDSSDSYRLLAAIGRDCAETVRLGNWLDMSVDCDLGPAPFLSLVHATAIEVRNVPRASPPWPALRGWHVPLVDEIVEVAKRRSALIESEIDAR